MPLEPASRRNKSVATFDPQKARKRDAATDAEIVYAKRVRDWPMLRDAIKRKLDDQSEFVAWWRKTVTPQQGPGRGKKTRADHGVFSMEAAEKATQISHQQVSKWDRRLKEPDKYEAMLYGDAYARAMAETVTTTAAKWTGDPESYTPAQYIEAARAVMGEIDLDPASNEIAQRTVRALEYFDQKTNGLGQPWHGRVFLNPPYNYPLVAEFIRKLISEHDAKRVTTAVLLTNNNTDTRWWHEAASGAAAVCFTLGRINFYKADGQITQPTNGQTFFYFGADPIAFASLFDCFGLIMRTPDP